MTAEERAAVEITITTLVQRIEDGVRREALYQSFIMSRGLNGELTEFCNEIHVTSSAEKKNNLRIIKPNNSE